jgi:threonyl-tRNA synthetase
VIVDLLALNAAVLRSLQDKISFDICREPVCKIQRAEQMKVHTMFVIGKRDMEANAVSVHGKGNLGAKPRAEAIAELLKSIKDRRAN